MKAKVVNLVIVVSPVTVKHPVPWLLTCHRQISGQEQLFEQNQVLERDCSIGRADREQRPGGRQTEFGHPVSPWGGLCRHHQPRAAAMAKPGSLAQVGRASKSVQRWPGVARLR